MLDEIEGRLREWAHWWIMVESGGDGYPKQSVIQLFRDGFTMEGEFGARPLCSNPRAQETDVLIKRMTKFYPRYTEAIQAYYLSKKEPLAIAMDLGISKRTLYRRLDGAKDWIVDKINNEIKRQVSLD